MRPPHRPRPGANEPRRNPNDPPQRDPHDPPRRDLHDHHENHVDLARGIALGIVVGILMWGLAALIVWAMWQG